MALMCKGEVHALRTVVDGVPFRFDCHVYPVAFMHSKIGFTTNFQIIYVTKDETVQCKSKWRTHSQNEKQSVPVERTGRIQLCF